MASKTSEPWYVHVEKTIELLKSDWLYPKIEVVTTGSQFDGIVTGGTEFQSVADLGMNVYALDEESGEWVQSDGIYFFGLFSCDERSYRISVRRLIHNDALQVSVSRVLMDDDEIQVKDYNGRVHDVMLVLRCLGRSTQRSAYDCCKFIQQIIGDDYFRNNGDEGDSPEVEPDPTPSPRGSRKPDLQPV